MASGKEGVFALPSLNFKEEQDSDQMVAADEKTEYLDKYDPLVFCRTCANMDTCLVPIFKEEGLNYNLNKKIEKYLPIHVSQEDDLPVHLCYHCASTLVAWDTLIVGCLEAEKKLNLLKNSYRNEQSDRVIEVNEDLPDETVDSDDEPLISKINKINNDGVKEDEQGDIAQNKNDYQEEQLHLNRGEHERRMSEKARRSVNFREPAIEEPDKGTRNAKKPVVHSVKKRLKVSCQNKHEAPSNKCSSCDKSFSCVSTFLLHLYGHVDAGIVTEAKTNEWICRVCGETHEAEEELAKHVLSHVLQDVGKKNRKDKQSKGEKSTPCKICGKMMSRKYTMIRHLATHTGERKYTCHRCGKQYAQESGLQRHVSVFHDGIRRYKCPICSMVFGSNQDLKSHQDTHTDPRPFQCDQCGRTFVSQKHLYHHRKYHHTANGMRKLCKVCNVYFSSASVLRRHHKVVHLGVKEFQCHVCSAQLTTKHYLQEHLKLHSNERSEVCSFCGKTFQMNGNLRQHIKTHMGKTQICHVCGKGFTRRCHLLIHMGSHRGVEHPRCGRCRRVFLLKDDLDKHSKKGCCVDSGRVKETSET